jgi:hypothetical protein
MMGAIDLLEGRTSNAQFISAARQHYKAVEEAGHLNMLLALVQSEESGEAIDGGIWEEALNSNYLWVDESKMVKCTSPEYTKELRSLLSKKQGGIQEHTYGPTLGSGHCK